MSGTNLPQVLPLPMSPITMVPINPTIVPQLLPLPMSPIAMIPINFTITPQPLALPVSPIAMIPIDPIIVPTAPSNLPNPPFPPNFRISDQTAGLISDAPGAPHTGPVAGIDRDLIMATTDNINVNALVKNVFIHTGSGEDAIDVSATGGTNVLDGSTGSNFLVGAASTSNDTFFVDDRNAPASIWDTIKNFHSGDNTTIFGITRQDFTITTLDNQGAVGNMGLTFDFSAPGKVDARMTLVGFTSADLTNGKLTTSFGTTAVTPATATSPALPGADFMMIHAT